MTRIVHVACALSLALVACRGGGNGDDTGDDTPIDAPPGGVSTIMEIQNDAMAPGTMVEVRDVIVTAIDSYGARTGDMWVQDPAGGPYSGIKVFGVKTEEIAVLMPGDIVTITNAEKDEFALSSDMSGKTVTELKGAAGGKMTVTKTSSGALPVPAMVDALAIGRMAAEADRDAEWEKWEGVLIKVVNARQQNAIRGFSDMEVDQKEFTITGDARVQSAMAPLPMTAAASDCYMSITGLGDYFFEWLVQPTATDQLVSGGTTCAPLEEGAACTDGMDNDGNVFADCMDRNCQATEPSCSTVATIADVQAGTATGTVTINDVYVTGISFSKKHLWVSQSLTAAANEGIYVFRGTTAAVLPMNIEIGAKVNVVGTAQENNDDMDGTTITQLTSATVTFVAAPTTPPVPVVGQNAAALSVEATGEPYESVLVTLTNVKVTTLGNAGNFFVGTATQSGTMFKFDDDMYRFGADDLNDCFATITGVWSYNVFDNVYVFLPRATGMPAVPDGTLAPNPAVCN